MTIDDDRISRAVENDEPLSRIKQTADEWLLGSMHVDKIKARGGTSWRGDFDASARFYKRAVALADGRRVVGVILHMRDRDQDGNPIEYLAGWVPADREQEADGWIDFLNKEIAQRLASRGEQGGAFMTEAAKTDEDHVRYMLDGGDRGLLGGLYETKDAWGFGGTLWLAKDRAQFKSGPATSAEGRFYALQSTSRFYSQRFHLEGTGAQGWALWFQPGPIDSSRPLGGRSLCGWVPLERGAEVEGWIEFLNAEIRARLTAAAADHRSTAAATATERFQGTMAMFQALGLPVPEADSTDDLVKKLGELSRADGPIDARSKVKP